MPLVASTPPAVALLPAFHCLMSSSCLDSLRCMRGAGIHPSGCPSALDMSHQECAVQGFARRPSVKKRNCKPDHRKQCASRKKYGLLFIWPRKADKLCGRKQRRLSIAERDHLWMGALDKDMLLILYVINIAQVTSRGGIVSPGHFFKLQVRSG